MAPKRPLDTTATTASQRKRARRKDARRIHVQPDDAGPSTSLPKITLPHAIDLEKLIESRQFEISAMNDSMKKLREAGGLRAWQTLPRHLRRRAASHHVRRLPTRLRAKARYEMKDEKVVKAPKSARLAKARKAYKNLDRAGVLKRRQVNKAWLETHLWHAKRAKMIDIWGYRLAERPAEKCFRAAYRASQHGCTLHDASYFGTIKLRGTEEAIAACLKRCCDPCGPDVTSQRFIDGARHFETFIYNLTPEWLTTWPTHLIGPATVFWRPAQSSTSIRELLLRAHPSIYKSVLDVLERSARKTRLELHEADPEQTNVLRVEGVKDEVSAFELTGPRATEVLAGVLRFVKPKAEFDPARRRALESMSAGLPPAASPPGTIISALVDDPRLRFPPKKLSKKASTSAPSLSASASAADPWAGFSGDERNGPDCVELSPSFERRTSFAPKFRQRDLDKRRAKLGNPGARLSPTTEDERIEITLLHRSLGSSSTASPATTGWTLLLPRGWGMAFWHSLVFSNIRLAGLRERRHQDFEASIASFPSDFPTTAAYDEIVETAREKEEEYFERCPPAKRPGYGALGTPSPFKADWRALLGFPGETDLNLIPTAPVDVAAPSRCPPFLLIGDLVKRLADASAAVIDQLKSEDPSRIRSSLRPLFQSLLGKVLVADQRAPADIESALVRVRVRPVGRGSPEALALIYNLSDEQRGVLLSGGAGAEATDMDLSANAIVGRITTGNFSLKQGYGMALACVPFALFFDLLLRDVRDPPADRRHRNLVAFRNKQSRALYFATLQIVP